jgi:hypothetical protein
MDRIMTRDAQRAHVGRVVAVRVPMRQVVVSLFGPRTAGTIRVLVEKQTIPLLAAIRLGGALLRAPFTWVAHLFLLYELSKNDA